MKVTDCQCEGPGWCQRHQREKSEYWFRMCQRVPSLFEAWEAGEGPTSHPEQVIRKPVEEPCIHLSDEIRRQDCESCRSKVRVKVFQCALHTECTLLRELPDAFCCRKCPDYSSSDASRQQFADADQE